MTTAARPGVAAVAARTGPIHSFAGDPGGLAAFLGADDGEPVPVLVRSLSSPGVLARGRLVGRRVDGDGLVGTVEWPADLEDRVGDAEPAARCVFGPDGRLARVEVDLDDDDDDDPDATGADGQPHSCGCDAGPCSCHPGPARDGPAAGDARDGHPGTGGTPEDEDAPMAHRDDIDPVETTDDAPPARPETGRQAANPAARTPGRPADDKAWLQKIDDLPDDPALLRSELRRAEEGRRKANREAAERRSRLEDLERAEEDRRQATMTESERIKAQVQAADRRAADADRRAEDAARRLTDMVIDMEFERAAHRNGFEYPMDVPRLVDRASVEVEEETGRVLGVEEAVKRLAKERPGLLVGRRNGGGGTPARGEYARPGSGAGRDMVAAGPADIKTAMIRTGKYSRM